jgi:hypothetical protein
MKTKTRHPPWWQLWMLVPGLGMLGLLEAKAPLPATAHKVVEIGLVLLVNGLIWLWLRANKAGLLRESRDGLAQVGEQTTIHVHSAPYIIAGSNGHGYREPTWYAPTRELVVDDFSPCEELDR